MPCPLVTKFFTSPVSMLLSVTAAPGIAAPDESVTVPRISPVFLLCPKLDVAKPSKKQKLKVITQRTAFFMNFLRHRNRCCFVVGCRTNPRSAKLVDRHRPRNSTNVQGLWQSLH